DEVAYARKLIALIEKYTSININVGTLQHWQDAKKAFDKQKALAASQAAAQPASGATSSTLRAILPAGFSKHVILIFLMRLIPSATTR
ncbi:hypothetical protein H0H92_002535, partial [Tricholoma furcatifolium]